MSNQNYKQIRKEIETFLKKHNIKEYHEMVKGVKKGSQPYDIENTYEFLRDDLLELEEEKLTLLIPFLALLDVTYKVKEHPTGCIRVFFT